MPPDDLKCCLLASADVLYTSMGSMGLVYLPTGMVDIYMIHVGKYTIPIASMYGMFNYIYIKINHSCR